MSKSNISISSGKITIDKDDYYAISSQTPIGKLLISKTEGEEFSFKGKNIKVTKIV